MKEILEEKLAEARQDRVTYENSVLGEYYRGRVAVLEEILRECEGKTDEYRD